MSKKYFDLEIFKEKTNGGLLFWEQEFCNEKIKKSAKGFSFDKGSSNVTKTANNDYIYTNFKESNKGISVIDYVIKRDVTDFVGACNTLFAQFQLDATSVAMPKFLPTKIWEDTSDEEGKFEIDYLQQTKNAKLFAPFLTEKTCNEYHFFEIEKYSTVRKITDTGKTSKLTVTATENYPIFGYKVKGFTKMYEPKAIANKDGFSSKHHFLGTKPPRHIYGYDLLQQIATVKPIDNDEFSIIDLSDDAEPELLEYIFIATGGSDGLNIASLGYNVIWYNSETELISEYELNFLFTIAKNVVYVPDLDKTGIKQAVEMGLMSKKHLKIKMLFPPKDLQQRGKKDITDWVCEHKNETLISVKYKFNELLEQAKQFEFWDFNPKRAAYQVNNVRLINFLHYNGFYVYDIPQMDNKSKRAISEKIFVKIKNNVITKTEPADVKMFVVNWMQQMLLPLSIQEMLTKSIFFGDNQGVKLLPRTELNTIKTTEKSQLYFYQNTILNITKNGIEKILYNKNDIQIWQKNIISRNFQEKPTATKITVSDDGVFDIEILNTDSKYLKLLINTSRFYWLKDADENQIDKNEFSITSNNLTEAENTHQKQELINKMYCLGHLLHEHKIKQKSYFVLGTDHAIGKSITDNKGGSGKSVIINGLYSLVPNHLERNGRELNKDTERFKYTDVDDEVRLLHFDEMNMHFDLSKFFTDITADVVCNWKGGKMVYVPFEFFTKIAVTMNAVPKDLSDSFNRRMLNFECSSYYHNKNEDFLFSRSVADSFGGQTLWDKNYKIDDWLLDDNFLIECLQFYLSNDKKPTVDGQNLIYRSARQEIRDAGFNFFTEFFTEFNKPNSDTEPIENLKYIEKSTSIMWINKALIYEIYKKELENDAKKPTDFKRDLETFCSKILQKPIQTFAKKKENGQGKTVEHFCFKVDSTELQQEIKNIATPLQPELFNNNVNINEPETDLPF